MSKPMIHAESSARRFGGRPEDYIEIHDFMDSSKSSFPDNRHRALTHNSWFVFIVERVFGHEIGLTCPDCEDGYVCDGQEVCPRCEGWGTFDRKVSVRDVAEQHILEDFGGKYIPTVSDYLEGMEFQDWMNNGRKGCPTSQRKIKEGIRSTEDPDPEPPSGPWNDLETLGDLVLDAANNRRNFTLD